MAFLMDKTEIQKNSLVNYFGNVAGRDESRGITSSISSSHDRFHLLHLSQMDRQISNRRVESQGPGQVNPALWHDQVVVRRVVWVF